jgi:glycosyltransferase involved in cell wall biosynthesis
MQEDDTALSAIFWMIWMPSLLFVTDNFPPENNAPSYRTYAHCIAWKKLGWEISILTSVPNAPKGKVFAGFKNRIFQTQKIDGIFVHRVWTFIAANTGFYVRIIDFLSFFVAALVSALFIKKHDIVISTSPQFFAGCAGFFISKIHRAKWVLEIRDLWPESIATVGRLSEQSKIYKLLFNIAMFMYVKADKIIVVTEQTREILINYGINGNKVIVARNGIEGADEIFFSNISRICLSQITDRKIRVGYVGTIGEAHALETLIEAAEILNDSDAFEFFLIGNGSKQKELRELSIKKKLQNLHFITELNSHNRNELLSKLDVGVITLKDDPLFETVIPSKIFDYAVAKLPILIGVRGEAQSIVENSNLGFYFEPENASQLVSRLIHIKAGRLKLDNKEREKFVKCHSRSIVAKKIVDFIIDT